MQRLRITHSSAKPVSLLKPSVQRWEINRTANPPEEADGGPPAAFPEPTPLP